MNITPTTFIAGWLLLAGMAGRVEASITDGLAGHWTFDETEGIAARDSSGRGNNGTVYNSTGDSPQWVAGQVGGALAFRGPGLGDDYVAVPSYPAPTNSFSVSAWVFAGPLEVWPQSTIVESGLGSGGPIGLVLRLKDRDQAFGPLGSTTTDSSSGINTDENVGFPTDSWQHVGVVAEGSTIRLFRNGAEVAASTNFSGTLAIPASLALGIGATLDDTGLAQGGYWQGKIDDVGLWTRGLTASQMASVFNAGKAGKDLTQADKYQNQPPTITEQPQNASRFVGETVAFTVKASGTGSIACQWLFNGKEIAGATNTTYNIASVKEADAGDYIAVVTSPGGSTPSQKAVLTVQKTTLATGMVGYWKFDEKEGETAADSTSNRNAGQLNNSPGDNSQWIGGKIGGALLFGGPDAQQYVLVPDFPKPTNTITVSLWAWAESRPTWASFVKNWGGAVAGQFHFGLFSGGGQENIYIKQADGKTPNTSDAELFPLGSWQHVAFTCDGSKVRLYRNGAQVAMADYNGTLIAASASALGIGAKLTDDGSMADTGAPGYWHGKLDDVALWNRGLSPGEIAAIYAAGLDGKGALEADVVTVIAPTITSQPSSTTAFEGAAVTLKVQAAGTPPLTFQWKKDGLIVSGATNSSLVFASAKIGDSGSYQIEIANASGTIASDPAILTVQQRPPAILVSEWKFENNLKDTSNHGNDGTALGSVEYVAGIAGRAVRLAAANPVSNPAANDLPVKGSDSWSINLWLKLSEEPKSLAYLAGFGPVLDRGAGTARALLAFTGSKNNNVYVWGSSRDTAGSAPYPIGQWAMATVTYDGIDGSTTLYLDGQIIGQNLQPRADIGEGDNLISLAPASNWNIDVGGDFDEFTIWNGVLNTEQLRQLLRAGAAPAPKLSVELRGSAVFILWPADATGFTLESTESLTAPQWSPVAGVLNNSATVNIDGKNRFFRLHK